MIGSQCHYAAVVPCPLDDGTTFTADARHESHLPLLLGETATVEFTDWSPGPGVLRSRIRLTPAGELDPRMARCDPALLSIAFDVDRQVRQTVQAGDVIAICRTGTGSLGFSVVRNDELVLAAGAVTAVPLGRDISASIPIAPLGEAAAPLHQLDPEFEWIEAPVLITVRGERRLRFSGRVQLEGHEVFVVHGALTGLPGADPCLSIVRLAACQPVAGSATALLLARAPMHVDR